MIVELVEAILLEGQRRHAAREARWMLGQPGEQSFAVGIGSKQGYEAARIKIDGFNSLRHAAAW